MKNILLLGVIVLLASVYLFAATNTSACARSNVAPDISKSPAGHINPNPLAGPGNAVPARLKEQTMEDRKNRGIYIPVPEARNVTFIYLSKGPVALLDGAAVLDESGNVLDKEPVLKTVGRVLLQSGLLIGSECGEHLRLNDAIRNGAIQNVGDRAVDLPLSDGAIVRLLPGQAIYVNDDVPENAPAQRSVALAPATHEFQCSCTCTGESDNGNTVKTTQTIDCPSCAAAGNQCAGINGNTCTNHTQDPNTPNTPPPQDGTISACSETLVPSIQPAPL